MQDKDKLGSLGEAQVIVELIKQDYTVFTQFDGKAPFDLVAYKDGKLYRISVKSCNTLRNNSYVVKINTTRHNRTKCWNVAFDKTSVDILAIYIEPEDRVILLDAATINNTNAISIKAVVV